MTTRDNVKRCIAILGMRTRLSGMKKLTPKKDLLIWVMEINTLKNHIKFSMDKVSALVNTLTDLRTRCVRTEDDLKNTLMRIKEGLTDRMRANKVKIDKWMEKIEKAHCKFWDAFFSLGISCILGNKEAAELKKV